MKLLCYGDSNTYGYDPRGWGGRYPAEGRWVDILKQNTGWDIINAGMNGREIPTNEWGFKALIREIDEHEPDALTIMLGTNDILCGFSVENVANRMRKLLQLLEDCYPYIDKYLIAPVPVKVKEYDIDVKSQKLNEDLRLVAGEYGVKYINAGEWNIELAFDDVHFTEVGHCEFANKIQEEIK